MEEFTNKKYDKIEVVYNRFKNAATQIVTTETFLPIVSDQDDKRLAVVDYIFEPTKEEIYSGVIT